MLIGELKEILEKFADDKDVSVFLQLTSNFGIEYEIEDWADNNGHLNLGIYDDINNLKSEFESIPK